MIMSLCEKAFSCNSKCSAKDLEGIVAPGKKNPDFGSFCGPLAFTCFPQKIMITYSFLNCIYCNLSKSSISLCVHIFEKQQKQQIKFFSRAKIKYTKYIKFMYHSNLVILGQCYCKSLEEMIANLFELLQKAFNKKQYNIILFRHIEY